MRWGLIARADDRGLSHLLWEIARNLRPDRVLFVDMCDERFPTRYNRYDGLTEEIFEFNARHVTDGAPAGVVDDVTRRFFDGLDLVFSAETFYGLESLAREQFVRTVLYVMPEFYRPDLPRATETWLPTSWLCEFIPHDRIMSLPCPRDRWPVENLYRGQNETLRVLMPAGNGALSDRNGAHVFMRALRSVTEPIDVTVWTQDRAFPVETRMSRSVSYRLRRRAAEYWRIYHDAHLAVLPRRYGGLCLPAIEAMGAGCALAMTSCAPNALWPIEPIACKPGLSLPCPIGEFPTYDPDPRDVAVMLDMFAADSSLTRDRQGEAREWAWENRWEIRRDVWRDALEEASKR